LGHVFVFDKGKVLAVKNIDAATLLLPKFSLPIFVFDPRASRSVHLAVVLLGMPKVSGLSVIITYLHLL